MQRRHEITPELLLLYEQVGDRIWSPSQISPDLKPKIKQWIIEGHINRLSRKHSCTESKYCINQTVIAKIKADEILKNNMELYSHHPNNLRELSHATGLETKYLSRRLAQIRRAQEGMS